MERPDLMNVRRRLAKKQLTLPQPRPARAPAAAAAAPPPPPPPSESKLAAIAANLNVRLRSADMPPAMQERAIRRARDLLDSNPDTHKRLNPTQLALYLKKEFDALFGPAWHCIVGKSFGTFVTHSSGGFVYFSIDKLCFLLFKTEVRPAAKAPVKLLGFNK